MKANKDHNLNLEKRQEIKGRLLLCFDVLRERHIAETYADVAKAMGMNPVTVRSAFARTNSYLSDRFLNLFLSTYSGLFSDEWLYTGLGEMIGESIADYTPMTERWQRVEMIMNNEGLNHITMSDAIGLNNHSTLYRVVKQHKKPHDETLRRILQHYPWYSEEWLLDGIGTPISNDVTSPIYIDHFGKTKGSTARLFEPHEMMSFPIAKEHARAGGKTGYGDEEYDESLSHVVLPVDRNYKGEYQVFSVEGASMDDGSLMSLADGDLVLARKIDPQYWKNGLHTRRWLYFIFVTRNDGVLIKKVIGQDMENGNFTLHSLNSEYKDIVINIREVVSIYNVIQVIQRKLSY